MASPSSGSNYSWLALGACFCRGSAGAWHKLSTNGRRSGSDGSVHAHGNVIHGTASELPLDVLSVRSLGNLRARSKRNRLGNSWYPEHKTCYKWALLDSSQEECERRKGGRDGPPAGQVLSAGLLFGSVGQELIEWPNNFLKPRVTQLEHKMPFSLPFLRPKAS